MMNKLLSLMFAAFVTRPSTADAGFGRMPEHTANDARVSAFLVPPDADGVPAGWSVDERDCPQVSELARRSLVAGAAAKHLLRTMSGLPASAYDVAVLVSGTGGRARIANAEWVDLTGNEQAARWIPLGALPDGTTSAAVEIEPGGAGDFRFHGMLLEGAVLPLVPIAPVLQRLRRGEPLAIALMGDSVTENAKGFKGGSSSFETSNAGLLLAHLRSFYPPEQAPVYIAHRDRSPQTTVEWRGFTAYDGRAPRRDDKPCLVNLAKGGATSAGAWFRTFDTFSEPFVWRMVHGQWTDVDIRREKPDRILRHGLAHYRPDLVFVNYGTNDANGAPENIGRSAAQFRFRIKCLTTRLQHEFGVPVILATPHRWTLEPHQNPHTQPLFAEAVRRHARETGLRLADCHAAMANDAPEGIHPGDAGHARMFETYRAALQP